MKSKKKNTEENKEKLLIFLKKAAKRLSTNRTKWESILYKHLKESPYKFLFQQPIITKNNHGYIIDFLLYEHNLIIEVDGMQYHGTKEQIKKDNLRTKRLKAEGYTVMRFWNNQISTYTKENILEVINLKLQENA